MQDLVLHCTTVEEEENKHLSSQHIVSNVWDTNFTSSYNHLHQQLQQQSISASCLHCEPQWVRTPQVGLSQQVPQPESGCHERHWCTKCGPWKQRHTGYIQVERSVNGVEEDRHGSGN